MFTHNSHDFGGGRLNTNIGASADYLGKFWEKS